MAYTRVAYPRPRGGGASNGQELVQRWLADTNLGDQDKAERSMLAKHPGITQGEVLRRVVRAAYPDEWTGRVEPAVRPDRSEQRKPFLGGTK